MSESTVTIERPDSEAMKRSAVAVRLFAQSFTIASAESYNFAAEELREVKARAAALDARRKLITRPLDLAKTEVMDLFREPLQVLADAESMLKANMLAFSQGERAKAAELQRIADQAAEAERAKLRAEAEVAHAEGRHIEAQMKQATAAIVAAPVQRADVPKAAGTSIVSSFDFEVTNLQALIAFCAANPTYSVCLKPDDVAIRAIVRALKLGCPIEGVRVFEREVLASRRSA